MGRSLGKETRAAVAVEIAWLDGGAEPAWPDFPDEKPIVRRSHLIRISKDDEGEDDEAIADEVAGDGSVLHVNSNAAAAWLQLLNDPEAKDLDWGGEVVSAYAGWSGRINGARLSADAEVDRSPSEWNDQFYVLFAAVLLDADPADFGPLVVDSAGKANRRCGEFARSPSATADFPSVMSTPAMAPSGPASCPRRQVSLPLPQPRSRSRSRAPPISGGRPVRGRNGAAILSDQSGQAAARASPAVRRCRSRRTYWRSAVPVTWRP